MTASALFILFYFYETNLHFDDNNYFFTNLLYSQILNVDFYRLCLEISLTSFCLMMYILDLMVEFVVSGVSALVRDSVLCSVVGAIW